MVPSKPPWLAMLVQLFILPWPLFRVAAGGMPPDHSRTMSARGLLPTKERHVSLASDNETGVNESVDTLLRANLAHDLEEEDEIPDPMGENESSEESMGMGSLGKNLEFMFLKAWGMILSQVVLVILDALDDVPYALLYYPDTLWHPKIDISRFTAPTYESCGLRTVFHNFAFRWGSGVATRIWWWDGGVYTNSDAFVEKSLRIFPCFFFSGEFQPPQKCSIVGRWLNWKALWKFKKLSSKC